MPLIFFIAAIIPATLFTMQTSNLNSKFPNFYLIPKQQSAQREGGKEIERILVGRGKGEKREEEKSTACPTLLLTSH